MFQKFLFTIALALLSPITTLAQDGDVGVPAAAMPVTDIELDPASDVVAEFVDKIWKAAEAGNIFMLSGAALMLVVWLARKKLPMVAKMDPKWLPLLTLIISGFPALAMTLMTPGATAKNVVTSIVMIFCLATGSWSGIISPVRDSVLVAKAVAWVKGWLAFLWAKIGPPKLPVVEKLVEEPKPPEA